MANASLLFHFHIPSPLQHKTIVEGCHMATLWVPKDNFHVRFNSVPTNVDMTRGKRDKRLYDIRQKDVTTHPPVSIVEDQFQNGMSENVR